MLTHKGTKTIKTQRLILRKFKSDDAVEMYNNWASDENVTRYLTWHPHKSADETAELLKMWCDEYKNSNYYNWVIELEGKIIGNVSAVRIDDNSEMAIIGYCMAKDFWNKGIMTEAVTAIVDFLYSEVGVNHIEISHAVKNPGSGRVAQKCGFTYEGTKKEFFKSNDGEFLDISYYGLIKSDWLKKK